MKKLSNPLTNKTKLPYCSPTPMTQSTLVFDCTDTDLQKAGELIRAGELVVFPTETVYGLGANALDPKACRKIFQAKGRPTDNPLIVHLSSREEIFKYTRTVTDQQVKLMERCMPGPITFVLPKAPDIPDIVTAGLPTVAIRIPSLVEARKLISFAGVPIAAPSANRSGEPSPTTFEMAYHAMAGRVAAIVKGRRCDVGLESTVVRIENDRLEILRPGSITVETLAELGKESGLEVMDLSQVPHERPASPGMKYIHYKPKATVYLFSALEEILSPLIQVPSSTRVLYIKQKGSEETLDRIVSIGIEMVIFENENEYARELFYQFHKADQEGISTILAYYPPPMGIGRALRNRLIKASGGRFV
ncbi:MAG: L-threonylcarbamoyladenylate synthase [Spirochaetes bacterium]|nr:L-threonylcarbamoyladenylate synthase [Spirochaetota bacterium]